MQVREIVVLITTKNVIEAKKISAALIRAKKAACVNIIKSVDSTFYWQDHIQSEKETLLIVKSLRSHLNDIIKITKKHHSYEVPEIIALPIAGGDRAYLNWMRKAVR